jgi:alpha-tubulin suppressor-like RCC1 family protein
MSECALLQLAALGEADLYLVDEPTMTFFKQNYKKHTNFSIESINQKFKGSANFGETINCTISKHGDLIWKCYLEVSLSSIVSDDINTYCNRVGFKLLKKVELRIGGKIIDYHYSHWMHIWTELTHNTDMKLLLNKMVGNKANDGQLGSNNNPGTLMIPLLFFYNRHSSLALPLICLQYHDIEIIIDFDTFNNCISDLNILNNIAQGTMSNVSLWVDYVFLDTEERDQMSKSSHDYLIEIVQSQEISIPANKTSSVKLDFNHPTKFLAWALKDNSFTSTNNTTTCYDPIISANYNSVLVVRSDGYLWGWGANNNGQLGLGTISDVSDPVRITDIGLNEVKSLNTGSDAKAFFTFIIKQNGSLWATGLNTNGQLGLGDNTDRSSFTQVGTDTDWEKISSGSSFTIAIKTDGSLWGTGLNTSGQLGLGDNTNRNIFTKIDNNIWIRMATTLNSIAVIKNDNTLWTSGLNTSGQLGLGDNTNRNVLTQVIIGGVNTWSKISGGSLYMLALNTNNILYGWGSNAGGQLGLGNITSYNSPQQISVSTDYVNIYTINTTSYLFKNDNTVWSAGSNLYGQLGYGLYNVSSSTFNQIGSSQWQDIKIGASFLLLIDNTYNLYLIGSNRYNQMGKNYIETFPYKYPTLYTDNDTFLSYYIGSSNFIIKSNGTLWSSGNNTRGQLGSGDLRLRYKLIQIGTDTNWLYVTSSNAYSSLFASAGIKTDGTLWTWGTNTNGVLGLGNNTNYYTPQKVGVDTNWSKISIGSNHMMAIKSNGTLWAWGMNTFGQLGTGSSTSYNSPQQIGVATNWSKIFCGEYSSFAIKTDGTLWATGYNFYGTLGVGNNNVIYQIFLKVGTSTWNIITSSNYSTLGLKTDGTLWSWGYNNNGQLGLGNLTNYNSPQQIGTSTWIKISNKQGYGSKGIKSDGTLWSWGNTLLNSLGTDIINDPQTTPLQVGTDTDWIEVDGGYGSGFAIKTNGTKWIWGSYTSTYIDYDKVNFIEPQPLDFIVDNCVPGEGEGDGGAIISTLDNFTYYGSVDTSISSLSTAKIIVNQNERIRERDFIYFNYVQPYQHFNIKPDLGINIYSFALYPSKYQPSGTFNLSKVHTLNLEINPTYNPNNNTSLTLYIYAFSYNILRIDSGMGGLAFSN